MSSGRALVVDNEKVVAKVLAGILEEQGYQVTCAYGGLEALQQLKDNSYDLVFLDLVMPRVGGDRICRYITQSPRHARTKVFIVSAIAIEARQKIAELRPFACIAKAPYQKMKDNILSALRQLDATRPPCDMIMSSDGVQPRTVVEELLFAQRHFEAILSSMREAVIELDTDCIITYVNPPARALLGKEESELIGRNFNEGFSPENGTRVTKTFNGIMQIPEIRSAELQLKIHDHEYSLSFRNVIRDGALIGATVVVNDLTETKLLERERYLRERLTGVVEMAGAAAHELNQPLAVISGHAQLLMKDCGGNEKLERRIRVIYDQVERLGKLTQQFTNIVSYKTKDYGSNITIVDIEKASKADSGKVLKGFWE